MSELNGQTPPKIGKRFGLSDDSYAKWNGMIQPMMSDWNFFDNDKSQWDTIDHYLTDNTIDGDIGSRERTDYPTLKLFIVRFKPQPPPTRTLTDLLRYNQLNDFLGFDKSTLALSGQPLDQLIPALSPSELSKPSPMENMIPSAARSGRGFRLATLGSIGYGPKYRFYR